METVDVGSLSPRQTFRMPWREPGVQVGQVLSVGLSSVYVHIPRNEGDGWDSHTIAYTTQVIPCGVEHFTTQGSGAMGSHMRNKSAAENPVDLVHRLCGELGVANRDKIIAAAVEAGVNINTAKTQYYAFRKKHQ